MTKYIKPFDELIEKFRKAERDYKDKWSTIHCIPESGYAGRFDWIIRGEEWLDLGEAVLCSQDRKICCSYHIAIERKYAQFDEFVVLQELVEEAGINVPIELLDKITNLTPIGGTPTKPFARWVAVVWFYQFCNPKPRTLTNWFCLKTLGPMIASPFRASVETIERCEDLHERPNRSFALDDWSDFEPSPQTRGVKQNLAPRRSDREIVWCIYDSDHVTGVDRSRTEIESLIDLLDGEELLQERTINARKGYSRVDLDGLAKKQLKGARPDAADRLLRNPGAARYKNRQQDLDKPPKRPTKQVKKSVRRKRTNNDES